ncbi:aldolase [Methylocystis sp. IM3]|uniref:aldolase n=1 Tax=unclassified Methylocystis TaxID=2625913 RepID=UPI0030F7E2D3
MRSVLALPADRRKSAIDALSCGASALLLRLGPAGGLARDEARLWARGFIEAARGREGRPRFFVQIPALREEAAEEDVAALSIAGVDGFFLEGCEGVADLQHLSVRLAVREAEAGLAPGALRIVALAAQTPAGVFALGKYAGASTRLAALAMDDAPLPGGASARAMARTLLTLGAAAAGVGALAAAPPSRGSALEAGCQAVLRDGFSGLVTAAAGEIPVINRVFGGP